VKEEKVKGREGQGRESESEVKGRRLQHPPFNTTSAPILSLFDDAVFINPTAPPLDATHPLKELFITASCVHISGSVLA
jgi:hypothetical protein